MKKYFSLLVILLVLVMMAGCKNNDKIKITIGMWPEPFMTDDVEMFNEWKRLFEEDYPQYEIEGKPYTYSVDTFFPMANNGTTPTVFQTWFTEPQKLIKNGFVKDITQPLKDLGWYDKMDPEMREALTHEEKVYGVPRDGYGLGLFINLSIFEEVGLVDDWNNDGVLDIVDQDGNPRYPETFAELKQTASYITQTEKTLYDKNVAGLVILSANNNGGWQFSNIAWNFGAELQKQNQDGTWVSNLNSPEAIEALTWIKEMKWEEETLPASASLTYGDWYNKVATGQAAMAFAGNDAISMPITNYNMNKDHVAFVPMPEGPNGEQYSLFGGTPYMFASQATDEQIKGALLFLEYMGRSPEMSEVSKQSMRVGMETAVAKGMPILPTIKPWINEDYLTYANLLEQQYVNVEMSNFQDFYDRFHDMRKAEEPYYTQDMYEILDACIQQVLTRETANPSALLASANAQFQTQYMSQINE